MVDEKVEVALNEQIHWEFYSGYMYLSMSAYCQSIGLAGCASWMMAQAQEEQVHAMRFYNYVISRGGRVVLPAIAEPPVAWDSVSDVFEKAYKHEQKVTSLINGLVELAIEEKDYATRNMLQWYVDEQVEEEETFSGVLDRLRLVGKDGSGLYMFDRDMASRVFSPPAAKQE